MKDFIASLLVFGLLVGSAWAEDCTLSKEFQLLHSQVLDGVLGDPSSAPLSGFTLELVVSRSIKGTVVTANNGEYSFGEVPAGRYRIRVRHSGDPFCAPKVKCNEAGCSIQREVKLNPKNKPEIVY